MSEKGLEMEARHYVKWTAEREAELRSLFAAGKSDPEIGAAMGIGHIAIYHRRHHLKLLRRDRKWVCENNGRWTPQAIALLTKQWGDGVPARSIAQELGDGFTKMAVIGKARRLKLASRSPGRTSGRPRKTQKPRRERGGIWQRIDSLLSDANKACTDLPPDSSPLACSIEGLIGDLSQCRYPVTTPEGEPQLFCAADTVEGTPYCARHCAVCYRRSGPVGSFQKLGDVALRVVDGLGQRLRDDNQKAA